MSQKQNLQFWLYAHKNSHSNTEKIYHMEGNFGVGKFGELSAKLPWRNKIGELLY